MVLGKLDQGTNQEIRSILAIKLLSIEPAIRVYINSSESNVTSCFVHVTMPNAKKSKISLVTKKYSFCYFNDMTFSGNTLVLIF